jgi:hypothetical protein
MSLYFCSLSADHASISIGRNRKGGLSDGIKRGGGNAYAANTPPSRTEHRSSEPISLHLVRTGLVDPIVSMGCDR